MTNDHLLLFELKVFLPYMDSPLSLIWNKRSHERGSREPKAEDFLGKGIGFPHEAKAVNGVLEALTKQLAASKDHSTFLQQAHELRLIMYCLPY